MKNALENTVKTLIVLTAIGSCVMIFKAPQQWWIVAMFMTAFVLAASFAVMGEMASFIFGVVAAVVIVTAFIRAAGAGLPILPFIIETIIVIASYMLVRRVSETNMYYISSIDDELKACEGNYNSLLLEEKNLQTAQQTNKDKLEKYRKLHEIKERLKAFTVFSDKIRFVLRNIIHVFHSEKTISLFLLKEEKYMRIEASKEEDMMVGERDQESLYLKNFDEWVISNKRSVLISDMRKEMRFRTDNGEKIRSLISVPVISKDSVVGLLRIVSEEANCFTQEDLRFLDLIADMNAKLLEEEKYV